MTPYEALVRGGHKHPEQILEDLSREGFKVVPRSFDDDLQEVRQTLGADAAARVLQRFMEMK